jgi:hypothetical protein
LKDRVGGRSGNGLKSNLLALRRHNKRPDRKDPRLRRTIDMNAYIRPVAVPGDLHIRVPPSDAGNGYGAIRIGALKHSIHDGYVLILTGELKVIRGDPSIEPAPSRMDRHTDLFADPDAHATDGKEGDVSVRICSDEERSGNEEQGAFHHAR